MRDSLALERARPAGRVARRPLDAFAEVLSRPLYAAYAQRLRTQVLESRVPHHVAVILDGNRRWAETLGLADAGAGHREGAGKVGQLLDWCAEIGIREVTLWALSTENLQRSPGELEALFDALCEGLAALEQRGLGDEHPLRIRVIGRHGDLPPHVRTAIARAERATAGRRGMALTIAIGYSGRDELIDACRAVVLSLAEAGVPPTEIAQRVTRDSLAARLYTAGAPDPDLIIRTSGEQRLSGFLPWQSAHSELYLTDVYWPAFREIDLLRAVRSYQQRERRFGA